MNKSQIIDLINKFPQTKYSYNDFKTIIDSYLNQKITEKDFVAFIKLIYDNNLSDEETFSLTKVMIESGKSIDWPKSKNFRVDKHSSGGIGDKVSLIIGPILATFNLKFAKISGKALGFTGGTLDILELIPGVKCDLNGGGG